MTIRQFPLRLFGGNAASAVPLVDDPSPVADRDRIRELDVIRGGALIGVLWMNVYAITHWLLPASLRAQFPTASLDHVLTVASDWLIDGKAQTLFGMLFGFGFAVFVDRATARADNGSRLYARRLLFLFALGLLHYALLWWGDILHDYAVVGLLLPFTRRWSDRTMLTAALVLGLVVPSLIGATLVQHHALMLVRTQFETTTGIVIHAGDYRGAVRAAIGSRSAALYGTPAGFGIEARFAGQFLFGAWVFRCGWLQRAGAHRRLFARVAAVTLPVGLVLSAPSLHVDRFHILDMIATPMLAIGWGSALVLACGIARFAPVLGAVAAFGRTALTNYVAQSLFYVAVSDGFGLDLAWRAGFTVNLLAGLAFVALQIAASAWWLRRYRFGPLEWLWRCATYGCRQPFRRLGATVRSPA